MNLAIDHRLVVCSALFMDAADYWIKTARQERRGHEFASRDSKLAFSCAELAAQVETLRLSLHPQVSPPAPDELMSARDGDTSGRVTQGGTP